MTITGAPLLARLVTLASLTGLTKALGDGGGGGGQALARRRP